MYYINVLNPIFVDIVVFSETILFWCFAVYQI